MVVGKLPEKILIGSAWTVFPSPTQSLDTRSQSTVVTLGPMSDGPSSMTR